MKTNISLEKAQELVLNIVSPAGESIVPLTDTLGRVISRNIKAPLTYLPLINRLLMGMLTS